MCPYAAPPWRFHGNACGILPGGYCGLRVCSTCVLLRWVWGAAGQLQRSGGGGGRLVVRGGAGGPWCWCSVQMLV